MRTAREIAHTWNTNSRWAGIERTYTADDVVKLRGTVDVKHSIAEQGTQRLWDLLANEDYVHALGALTGNQALQQVKAGLKAIYLSGWQVAADVTFPDKCIQTKASIPPTVCRRL